MIFSKLEDFIELGTNLFADEDIAIFISQANCKVD